jgi:hypothetical protein
LAVFSALMQDEASVSVEYRITRPDGSVRWVQDRGFQVRDAEGRLVRLTGIVTDISVTNLGVKIPDSRKAFRFQTDPLPTFVGSGPLRAFCARFL